MTNKRLENVVHESHESAWCIAQPKHYNLPLVKTFHSLKCNLPFVPKMNKYMVISTLEVQLGEDGRIGKLVHQFFETRHQEAIFDAVCLPVDSKAKKRKFKQDHIKTTTTIDDDSPEVFDSTGDNDEVFDGSPTTPASLLTLILSIKHSSRQSI
ncbi:hypothetical protein LWI29_027317 [Acer saccharum]|uniref:Uncharacterized protein n=1 Tax=Acer saccharum TaxID=4024 RepID=A0AA39SXZ7_ACESA|nr:hypothetical protein LWI29_027317 [Acer saccharum]